MYDLKCEEDTIGIQCKCRLGSPTKKDVITQVRKGKKKRLFRGFVGNGVLPSYVGAMINTSRDPY